MRSPTFAFVASCAFLVACTYPAVGVPRGETPASSRAAPARTTLEGRIFDLINAERRHQGLPALQYDVQLDEMAQIQATNMAHFQKMAHVIPDAKLPTLVDRAHAVGYPYGRIAENVALGYPTAEAVVDGWMASRGHRENILNPAVVETGIAVRRSKDGGLYYCQVFGRRLASL